MWCSIIFSPFPFPNCARDFFLIRYRLLLFLPLFRLFVRLHVSFCLRFSDEVSRFVFGLSFFLARFTRYVLCTGLSRSRFSAYLSSWLSFTLSLSLISKYLLCEKVWSVAWYAPRYFKTQKMTTTTTMWQKKPFTYVGSGAHIGYMTHTAWLELFSLVHSLNVSFIFQPRRSQKMWFSNVIARSFARHLLLPFSLEKLFSNWIVLYCLKINVIRPICLLSVPMLTLTRPPHDFGWASS